MSVYGFPWSLPRLSCHSLRVNQAWTYCFVPIMRTRGTEERLLPAQFEVLVETGQKGKRFFFVLAQIKQAVADGSINYAVTGTLIPKVHFLLKGRS